MTVFYDRRHDSYNELSGEPVEYITGIPGQNNAGTHGYSGGLMPPMANVREEYPLDQTVGVVNMR